MHNFAGSCLTHIQRGRQNEQSHTLLHESFSQPSISPCASGCSEHGDDFTEHHDSERNWASHACLHSSYWAELHRSDFVVSAHFPRVKHELFVWNVFDPFFARKENSEEKPEAHCMGPSSATGSLTWVSLSVSHVIACPFWLLANLHPLTRSTLDIAWCCTFSYCLQQYR